jgi:hypothetical protein
MKSTRKHELQTNELADAIGNIIEKARPHAQAIGYGVLAVVVLVLILVILPGIRGRSSGQNAAVETFALAQASGQVQPLRDFIKDYPDSGQAPAARLLLAERNLAEVVRGGQGPKGEDAKAKAAGLLAEAKELYTQVAEKSPTLEPLARAGLAIIAIQEGDLDKGRAQLQEVVTKWPQSLGADKAKVNLEALAAYKPVPFSNEPIEEPAESSQPAPAAGESPAAGEKAPTAGEKAPAAGEKAPAPATEKPAAPTPKG